MARSFETCRAPYLNNSVIFDKSPEYYSNKNIYTYH